MFRWMYKLPLRLSSLFRKEKTDEDLDGELQFHLQAQTEDFIARGMDPGGSFRCLPRCVS